MKFLRFLCNLIYFIALCFGISVVQVGAYDVLALQDGFSDSYNLQAIHVYGNNDNVGYIDEYTFWGTDLSTGVSGDSKYRIRNWVDNDGWRNNMAWADKALDVVIGATKPIFVPIAQINALKDYYRVNDGKENDLLFTDEQIDNLVKAYSDKDDSKDETVIKMNNALYELVYFSENSGKGLYNVGEYHITQFIKDDEGNIMMSEDLLIKDYAYDLDNAPDYVKSLNFGKWERENRKLFNHAWKLNKYNGSQYDVYFRKFIDNSGRDINTRFIRSSVAVLYYQQLVAILVALFIVVKYPINLFSYRYEGKGKHHKDE